MVLRGRDPRPLTKTHEWVDTYSTVVEEGKTTRSLLSEQALLGECAEGTTGISPSEIETFAHELL